MIAHENGWLLTGEPPGELLEVQEVEVTTAVGQTS